MSDLSFSSEQFGFLFPYFICLDDKDRIDTYGSSLAQLCAITKGGKFSNYFDIIQNPKHGNEVAPASIPVSDMVIIHSVDSPLVYLKGKFEKIYNTGNHIFIGTPCYITREEEIKLQFSLINDPYKDKLIYRNINTDAEHFESLASAIQFFENVETARKEIDSANEGDEYAITISSEDGKIQWCNSNFLELSGQSFEDVKGKRPRDVVYGKRSVYVDRDYVDQNVKKGKPFYFENIGYHKSGREFWFGLTVYPVFNFKNEIIGRIHFIQDISLVKLKELKQEEDENLLKLSLQAAKAGVWSYDVISGDFFISESFRKLTNINTEAEITLNSIIKMVHPDDRNSFEDEYFDSLEPAKPGFSFEARIRVDGLFRYFRINGNCIKWTTTGKPVKLVGMLRDVTNEKQYGQELEKQRIFYEKILNQIPSDIAVFDKDHRYLFVNPEAIKDPALRKWIIGKTEQEYREFRKRPNVLSDKRQQVFDQAVSEKQEKEWEEITHRRDGREEYHLRKMYPVFNEQGELEIVIGYGIDITERKKIEEKIQLSEARYRSVFDHSLALICIHDLDGRIMDVNNATVSTLGYPREALIGQPLYGLIPEDKRDEYGPGYLDKITKEGKAEGIVIMRNKEGRLLYLLYQNFLMTDDTEKPYVIGFSQNITERIEAERALKKSEEKYRSIIANMNMGLLEEDANEQIIYANNSFCKMIGFEPVELIGKNASAILFKDVKFNTNKEHSVKKKQLNSDAYELMVKDKKGDIRWWLVSSAPTYDNSGKFSGSIGIHLDITMQKNLEHDLRKAKSDAERSAHAKEIFLANISHEIRTPMNAILGIGRLLSKTSLNTQQKFYHNTIQNAANNLLVIINDLLDFSKIEAGKLSLEQIGFDLRAIMENTVLIMKHKAEEKGLVLKYTINPNVAPVLIGDPYRINQVLLNLISNSLKFTEKGEVRINCSLQYDDHDAQRLQFQVVDTGIGMSKEYMTHLFDKFSQEDESVTRKFGGTGLGMSISRQIIELMGGSIKVHSVKNEGTTISFTIKFPKGTVDDLPVSQFKSIDTHILKGKKILLAEDNEMNRFLAVTVLSQYGAQVEEAEDGEKAIEKLTSSHFDLVLMDVQMPVKDGLETTRYIRRNIDTNIPIIALTANAYKKEEEVCINSGMNDFISKPFEEEKLVQMVAKWLGRSTKQMPEPDEKKSQEQDKLYDLEALYAIGKGDNGFVKKMIGLFTNSMPDALKRMQEAYLSRDWKTLSEITHSIKSAIKSMGVTVLDRDIDVLENYKNNHGTKPDIEGHINKVQSVLNEIIKQLNELELIVQDGI